MPHIDADRSLIDATPTKEFFISMLVRDIDLVDAIADLFDNCVDGARRLKPNGNYEGLWVRIKASPSEFMIGDNCGGIPVDVARSYAFRFGRPEGALQTKHGIGQFGIGMKRALFKLGKKFTVESTSKGSSFTVKVDVEKWKEETNVWNFKFDELDEEESNDLEDCGTNIRVTELNEGVTSAFRLENFRNVLRERLEAKHQETMERGLKVTIDNVHLKSAPSVLLRYRDQLKPGFYEKTYRIPGKPLVVIQSWAGVADSDPVVAGWYVYCNERLILEADQSEVTGWGAGLPRFHNQYARFRGYVYFDCDDADLLPWNTTKNGVSADSTLYRAALQQMVNLGRPVVDFLNALRREERDMKDTGESPLFETIEKAKPTELKAAASSSVFVAPVARPAKAAPRTGVISYRKPLEEIASVQKVLKASSRRAVGEKTFDYFYKAECAK